MSVIKRAGLSLWSRKARTLITLGAFLVVSVMVLAGVLITGATAKAKEAATRAVGAEVRLEMDFDSLGAGGGGLVAPQVSSTVLDAIGASPLVGSYTYTMWNVGILDGVERVPGGPQNGMADVVPGGMVVTGVLESALLPDFRSGNFTLLSGEHLSAADRDERLLLIEERLAERNGLTAGDTVTVGAYEGGGSAEFTVAGIFRDPRPTAEPDPEFYDNPAHLLYASVGGFARLNGAGDGTVQAGGATFLLADAGDRAAFEEEAERIAGDALDGFALTVNDKALRQMTGPLESVTTTATVAMWLTALAGAAVLALLTLLAVRQRRREYGVLLALGERKRAVVAQQALEIVAVAALAIGLSAVFAEDLTQRAGQALLGREAAEARDRLAAWEPPPPGSTGIDEGRDPGERPVENADPIDAIEVRMDPAALATVGGVGLGIGLLATAVPATAVTRLSPRAILTKGS
ncbi:MULTISPECIES: FtsX-like permease family protein [Streptomyces]|uniref:ABC transporter permease n=2 Tax=Streptomyces TaxID=1883 RepID=A0ABN2URT7_9ACTN|nr:MULTISPECIES: ABC transporter permease [Streptomyces]QKV68623.1 ABC transporter permease [Streptomyces harbinensis]SFS65458.1 putative ABC transport system permease protein [Streptomyces harbinensis]